MDPAAATDLPLQIGYTLVFVLLLGVTGGIGYLTWTDWRDRRRRKREEQGGSRRSK